MRPALGLVMVLACACTVYDPTDEIPHRAFADTHAAIAAIVGETGGTRVYAVGEYHPSRRAAGRRSPLQRFTSEIVDLLAPGAKNLVVETWVDEGCSSTSQAVTAQVARELGRPASTTTDIEALVMKSAKRRLRAHGLAMTCIEHDSLLDDAGRVDFLRLLQIVTDKLGARTRELLAEGPVIVYGGALHNDLYPRWPLEDLSYASSLARELGGAAVTEIDLVVPEVVAPMPLIRNEPWFPLLGLSGPERVIVWERAPDSFVVILPAQDLEARKVALPVASL
jgi:hypothetical protein